MWKTHVYIDVGAKNMMQQMLMTMEVTGKTKFDLSKF